MMAEAESPNLLRLVVLRPAVMRIAMAVVLIFALILVSGCRTRGGPIAYETGTLPAPDRPSYDVAARDLPIAPYDQLEITVFRVPDLSGEFEVALNGNVDLPLLGTVQAVNHTPVELASELEALYGARYLTNPDVQVRVAATTSRNAVVEGAVNNPGVFTVGAGTDLITAVALAGGLTDNANPRRIAIFRRIDGEVQAAAFDLGMIRADQLPNPDIYPGDIVVVDGSGLPGEVTVILQAIGTLGIFATFF